MSMAYDVRRITYDVFTFARTPLKQITTTPIDKGLGPLVPIIGFTEYNVNKFYDGYPSPLGVDFVDENTYLWTMDVLFTGRMTYYFTFFTNCPPGCVSCTSLQECTICKPQSYRVQSPNPLCPCLPGFYEDASGVCQVCPKNRYCSTCGIVSGSANPGGIDCLSCLCSQHREVRDGNCPCKSGYQQDGSNALASYCVKIIA